MLDDPWTFPIITLITLIGIVLLVSTLLDCSNTRRESISVVWYAHFLALKGSSALSVNVHVASLVSTDTNGKQRTKVGSSLLT